MFSTLNIITHLYSAQYCVDICQQFAAICSLQTIIRNDCSFQLDRQQTER